MKIHSLTPLFAVGAATAMALGCSRTDHTPQPLSRSQTAAEQGEQEKNAGGLTTERAAPDAFGVPLPQGATLVSSAQVDDVRVFPARGQLTNGTRVVAGAVGVGGVDHVYRIPLGYDDAVAFYDRTLESSMHGLEAGAPERVAEDNSTAWTFEGANGKPQRVEVRDTTPTTIEVVAVTGATAAVKGVANAQPGVANAQPGTDLGGSARQWDAGIERSARGDAGSSLISRGRDGGLGSAARQWDAGIANTAEHWDAGVAKTAQRPDAGRSLTARAGDWM
jgi:hypothetical protein